MSRAEWSGLPGAELIEKGLDDIAQGVESIEACLVHIGRPRLNQCGIHFPASPTSPSPEIRLYKILSAQGAKSAHSQYNAMVRRLVSFERALTKRTNATKPPVGSGASRSDEGD